MPLHILGQTLVIIGFASWAASWGGLLLIGIAAAHNRQRITASAALLLAQPILAAGTYALMATGPGTTN